MRPESRHAAVDAANIGGVAAPNLWLGSRVKSQFGTIFYGHWLSFNPMTCKLFLLD
jgi:hypothetical protein